jgi:septal ring factor EnvC (AmiA/AmiB activator)
LTQGFNRAQQEIGTALKGASDQLDGITVTNDPAALAEARKQLTEIRQQIANAKRQLHKNMSIPDDQARGLSKTQAKVYSDKKRDLYQHVDGAISALEGKIDAIKSKIAAVMDERAKARAAIAADRAAAAQYKKDHPKKKKGFFG